MDYEKLIKAVNLCGSTPKVEQCKKCAYWAGGDMSKCIPRMTTDAATALSTLQAENEKLQTLSKLGNMRAQDYRIMRDRAVKAENENEKLRAELERVKRERGAAIADWQGFCAKCVWNGKQYLSDGKMDDRCKTCRDNNKCNWEWRGIKED